MIPRSRLLRDSATIIRTPGARNQFGEWEDAAPVEVAAACVTHPDSGQDRELGEEGSRTEGRRFFWFSEEVDVQLAGQGQTTDRIRHDGVVYRVIEIQRFKGSHVRVVGSRVEGQ